MKRPLQTAICVLRAEQQSYGLLITMTVTQDIAHGSPDPPRRFTDPSGAMAAVAEFLDAAREKARSGRDETAWPTDGQDAEGPM